MAVQPGTLYVCATPIGNLEDITLRAIRTLQEVDLIAAEDTRVTRKLLAHYDIHTRLTSYREHNEAAKARELIDALRAGGAVALVSDAGMPGISDPGHRLITVCIAEGIPVEPVPGPSSLITALVISGLPTDSFVFQGFLPRKKGERARALEELTGQERTVVLFESPRRLGATLAEVASIDSERPVVIARELTKKFQEVLRGSSSELAQALAGGEVRGEVVLLIGPAPRRAARLRRDELRDATVARMKRGVPKKQAISEVAKQLGVTKRAVYEAVMDIHERDITT